VEIDRLRPHSTAAGKAVSLEKHTLVVPAELTEWVHDVNNLRDQIKDKCGAMGLTLFDPEGGKGGKNAKNNKGGNKGGKQACKLVILGDKSAANKAAMLLKLHAKHQTGLKSIKSHAANLEATLESERAKRGNSVVEEFPIEYDLIGMIVGKGGSNIKKAEKDSGVHRVEIDDKACVCRIHAPDRASAERCRALLEVTSEDVELEQSQLWWVIGTKGANIRELQKETGVSRAEINKDVNPPVMTLTGSREHVEEAMLWLQCHLDYLDELQEDQDAIDVLQKEMDVISFGGRGGKAGGKGKGGKGKGGKGTYFQSGGGGGGGGKGGRGGDDKPPAPKPAEAKPEGKKGKGNNKKEPPPAPKPAGDAKPRPNKKGGDAVPKPKEAAAPKPKGDKPAPKPKPAPADKPPAPKPISDLPPKPKRDRGGKKDEGKAEDV